MVRYLNGSFDIFCPAVSHFAFFLLFNCLIYSIINRLYLHTTFSEELLNTRNWCRYKSNYSYNSNLLYVLHDECEYIKNIFKNYQFKKNIE